MIKSNDVMAYGALGALGIFGPILFPDYTLSIAYLWMMVLMACTWDTLGGQMGYNSLGNITFFGVGMYISAAIQVSMFYDLGLYTASYGAIKPVFTEAQYYSGFIMGVLAAGVAVVAWVAHVETVGRPFLQNWVQAPCLGGFLRGSLGTMGQWAPGGMPRGGP